MYLKVAGLEEGSFHSHIVIIKLRIQGRVGGIEGKEEMKNGIF